MSLSTNALLDAILNLTVAKMWLQLLNAYIQTHGHNTHCYGIRFSYYFDLDVYILMMWLFLG